MTLRPGLNKQDPASGTPSRSPRWLRRLGVAGTLFFLIKGLLWLLVPLVLLGWQWIQG